MTFVLAGQIFSINLNEIEEIDKMQRICFHANKLAKPRSYASLKLRLTHSLTYLLTDRGKV